MKLTRIVLEDYKRFTGRVVVDGLAPGLNVFTGDNEAGKSTLADAVRKVFLERHKSSALDGLAPWSKPTAKPQVEVAYAIDGIAHRLTKSFAGSKGTCELHIGERRFDGDEAEEALAALLGFERAQKGASRPEHGGIPGLLWVQQGTSQDVQVSAQHALGHIREALGELAGGTIAQGDDVLIQAVRAEMAQLMTDKQRRPFGAYAEAETQLAEARAQLTTLEEQERAFNQDLERLATLQAEVDSQAASKPWETLEARAVAAAETARSLATARLTAAQTSKELVEVQRTATLLNSQEQAAVENEQAVQQLTQQLAELQRQLDETRLDETTAHAEVVKLQTQNTAATEHRSKAEAAENYTELVAKLDAAITAEDQTRAAFKTAADTAEAIRELTVAGTWLKLNPSDLLRLRAVESELVLSRAQVTAALTKLEYRLEPGVAAMLGGVPLAGQGATSLDVPTTLTIAGVGELTISPGVTDLPQLRTTVASLEDERARLLQAMGVTTLEEAEEKQTQCNESAAELKTKQALLKSQAPAGVDALKTALAAAEAAVEGLRKRLPAVPPAGVEGSLADARAAVELVLSKFDAARDHERKAVAARANMEGRHKQVAETLTAKQTQLQSAEYLDKRKQTRVDLVNANAAVATLRDKEVEAKHALDTLLATADEGAEERLKRSAAHAREAFQEKHTKLVQLRTRLEDVGVTGLGERLGQTRARIEQLQRRHEELARRAGALMLLYDLLVKERDALVQQLQAPLTKRIDEYLRRLLPQSQLGVTEGLTLGALFRGPDKAEFQTLSYGTREQLGVVARLAYADLLKDAGRPTLLIFDDAVTHSDRNRLAGVKRALLHAAERHQVLVLSCHPENWDDVGVPLRSLEDLVPVTAPVAAAGASTAAPVTTPRARVPLTEADV